MPLDHHGSTDGLCIYQTGLPAPNDQDRLIDTPSLLEVSKTLLTSVPQVIKSQRFCDCQQWCPLLR
jgi:hypothetical protein